MTIDHAPAPVDPTALAHRVAERIVELGLSEPEAAARAGMSTAYLRGLLTLGRDFDPPALLRLAGVLDLEALVERAGPPPAQDGPVPAGPPVLGVLTVAECWRRLGADGLGRIARTTPAGPVVCPVGYLVHEHAVLYRTAEGGALAPGPGGDAAFEVDRADRDRREGWSVLMIGPLAHVTDRRLLADLPRPTEPGRWVHLTPTTVTGRTIAGR
ncbi:pyridoxamine 5'-phosphate oxidase family protein [Kitasatospora sp. NPDC049285]|uniref:pyridoxamine 5'-phosphate oxidase family protein n=1 Tax=Kitasatospora sp. NPDC049285 TaxID=3157096 RepID=UPI0034295303